MTLRVEAPGLLTTVQDAGRRGHQREGVPEGGAMDPFALRVANLLVGNREGDAALEITLTGPMLHFESGTLVALAGAELGATVAGQELSPWRAVWIPAGSTLSFRGPGTGCRVYLAVAGGLAVPEVLGSRSTFVRARLGGLEGRALRAGDVLPRGAPSPLSGRIAAALSADGSLAVARWGVGLSLRPGYSDHAVVRLLPGSHAQALSADSREELFRAEFHVSPHSDRTGYRLEGPGLEYAVAPRLLSEAVTFGTVQLPPDGTPIVLMADRQTTGGYPRIGEVASVDLPLLAQLRPGDRVRFRPCSLAEAQTRYLSRESGIAQLRQAISLLYRSGPDAPG
jgi:antagonist of KipI